MKLARMAVLGIGVVAAGGAALIASNLANVEPEVIEVSGARAPEVNLSEVLVAESDIQLGTKLNVSMVRWQKWPKEGIAEGYIIREEGEGTDSIEEISGAITRSNFFKGEPIREGKLVKSDRGYMSAILPAGHRAIATTISTDTSAGGFILPNDRVDVIMTRRETGSSGAEEFITETILENIRVLAIDQTIEEKDGESVVVGETATLQLTPKQAEILTVAQQMADRLALSLRSLADSSSEETKSADHLLSGGRKGKVRLIRYGKIDTTKVGN